VSVVSRPFAVLDEPAAEGGGYPLLGADGLWRFGEIIALLVLGLAMIFLGVRPALRRLLPDLTGGRVVESGGGAGLTIQPPSVVPSAERSGDATGGAAVEVAPQDEGAAAKVQLRQVHGGVRSSLIDEVGQIVETQPEEAVRVIRGWLREP
jgi:flagellar M-ring protein FliF